MSGYQWLGVILATSALLAIGMAILSGIHTRRNRRRYDAAIAEMERILDERRREGGDPR